MFAAVSMVLISVSIVPGSNKANIEDAKAKAANVQDLAMPKLKGKLKLFFKLQNRAMNNVSHFLQ